MTGLGLLCSVCPGCSPVGHRIHGFNSQLAEYNDLQWRVKRFKVEPREAEEAPSLIERVDDSHLIGLRAPWVMGWQTLLANRVFNRHGEWTGGKAIARDRHLAGLYTDLTGNYETALDDFGAVGVGWMTRSGATRQKKSLKCACRSPPLPRNSGA